MRTIQKLSLIYGFEFNTEEETAELWIAAASAAGVDISRELLEKEVVSRFVPRVIQRIAAQASGEVVEKWSGRMIPLASSLIGAGLNYYFVRAWGERARSHFRKRHMEMRGRMSEGKLIVGRPMSPEECCSLREAAAQSRSLNRKDYAKRIIVVRRALRTLSLDAGLVFAILCG